MIIRTIVTILPALFMMAGGITHFVAPETFNGFIPKAWPRDLIHIVAGIAETGTGIALLIPRFRAFGGVLLAAICIAYTPFHVWDLVRPDPVIAPLSAAIIRLVLQAILIYIGYRVWSWNKKMT